MIFAQYIGAKSREDPAKVRRYLAKVPQRSSQRSRKQVNTDAKYRLKVGFKCGRILVFSK